MLLAIFPLICFLVPDLATLPIFSNSVTFLFTYINYLSLGTLAILGLYLNQTRIFISACGYLIIYHFCLWPDSFSDMGINSPRFFELISLAYPLGIGLLFIADEAPFFSWRNFRNFFLFFSPFLIMAIWISDFKESYLNLAYYHFIEYFRPIEVPQIAVFSLLFTLVVCVVKKKDKAFDYLSSSILSFFPLYTLSHVGMAYQFPSNGKHAIIILSFLVISIILLHTIFRMYWQRVYLDELTQISNRRALDEVLSTLSGQYSIAMIDIDHFKKFNDSFGHDAGDDVLKVVAQTLERHSGHAHVYRYGGEEFTLLFKGIDAERAFSYSDELKDIIGKRDFYIRQNSSRDKKDRGKMNKSEKKKVQITISIGLADGKNIRPVDAIKIADRGLYAAKEAGRNCVKIAQE